MSLINDALKKAQKLQMQGQAPPPPGPGGAPSTPNAPSSPGGLGAPSLPADSTGSAGSPQASSPQAGSGGQQSMTGQLFMLLAFGAGALIAVSVLATVYLLRRQPAAPIVAQAPAVPSPTVAAAPAVPEKPTPAPVTNTPQAALPQTTPPAAPAQMTAPAPTVAVTPAPATTPAMPATPVTSLFNPLPAPSLPALRSLGEGGSQSNGPDPTKPDPKILAYLDALQVAGIRISDTGSKVLMNDRVFREGEIVDQLLGLRLKKVENDMLTFVDDRGVIYTKNL